MCLIQPSTTLTSSPFLLSPISQPSRVHCGHGEENPSHDASLQKYYKVIFCSVVDRSVGQCLAFFMFTMFAVTLALRDTVFWDSMSLFVALCGQSMGTCRCNAIASLALWGGGSTASSHTKKKRARTNKSDRYKILERKTHLVHLCWNALGHMCDASSPAHHVASHHYHSVN